MTAFMILSGFLFGLWLVFQYVRWALLVDAFYVSGIDQWTRGGGKLALPCNLPVLRLLRQDCRRHATAALFPGLVSRQPDDSSRGIDPDDPESFNPSRADQ